MAVITYQICHIINFQLMRFWVVNCIGRNDIVASVATSLNILCFNRKIADRVRSAHLLLSHSAPPSHASLDYFAAVSYLADAKASNADGHVFNEQWHCCHWLCWCDTFCNYRILNFTLNQWKRMLSLAKSHRIASVQHSFGALSIRIPAACSGAQIASP